MLVSRSTDGGDHWSPVTVARSRSPAAFDDKAAITADPTDPSGRRVYLVWDRVLAGGSQPAMLSRTTDGGATWEPARAIFDPGPGSGTVANQIIVLPDGTLLNGFLLLTSRGSAGSEVGVRDALVAGKPGPQIAVIRSEDHGLTWSAPVVVADISGEPHDRARDHPIRDGGALPDFAVDPGSGTVYAAWADTRFSSGDHTDIALARSTGGARRWSAPIRVNRTPVAAAAFTPAVHVAPDGTVGVSYYDLRNHHPTGEGLTNRCVADPLPEGLHRPGRLHRGPRRWTLRHHPGTQRRPTQRGAPRR